jgi:hypothetical protein
MGGEVRPCCPMYPKWLLQHGVAETHGSRNTWLRNNDSSNTCNKTHGCSNRRLLKHVAAKTQGCRNTWIQKYRAQIQFRNT